MCHITSQTYKRQKNVVSSAEIINIFCDLDSLNFRLSGEFPRFSRQEQELPLRLAYDSVSWLLFRLSIPVLAGREISGACTYSYVRCMYPLARQLACRAATATAAKSIKRDREG